MMRLLGVLILFACSAHAESFDGKVIRVVQPSSFPPTAAEAAIIRTNGYHEAKKGGAGGRGSDQIRPLHPEETPGRTSLSP
jgi:hypothetical protein